MASKDLYEMWATQEKELIRLIEAPRAYLAEVGEDPDDDAIGAYLANNVLEIKREQYLSEKGWETLFYTLVTGTGGPHVEFSTDYVIRVFYGDGSVEFQTQDPRAREAMDRIEEFLKDFHGGA